MKKLLFTTFFLATTMVSCDKILKQNDASSAAEQANFKEKIGGEKDEHGCVTSAGYTWSNLQEDCIRLFESAYRLNPVDDLSNDDAADVAVISAFVLFNEDESEAELFLPETDAGIVLSKDKSGKYKQSIYTFDAENFVLYINNNKRYEAATYEAKDIKDVDNQVFD